MYLLHFLIGYKRKKINFIVIYNVHFSVTILSQEKSHFFWISSCRNFFCLHCSWKSFSASRCCLWSSIISFKSFLLIRFEEKLLFSFTSTFSKKVVFNMKIPCHIQKVCKSVAHKIRYLKHRLGWMNTWLNRALEGFLALWRLFS